MSTPAANSKNLKDLMDAVDRITKTVQDAEGVQKELGNQGFGNITLPDVEALMRTVQDKKSKPAPKPAEPAPTTSTPPPLIGSNIPTADMASAPPTAQEPTPPATRERQHIEPAPIAEIDELLNQHYTKRGIERTMMGKYHHGYRREINDRVAHFAQLASQNPPAMKSTELPLIQPPQGAQPTVAQPVPVTEQEFDPVEALKFVQSLNLQSGGSLSQPSGSPAPKSVGERWRDWRQNIDTLSKINKGNMDTNSAALIAEQMGSPDIAAVVRNQGLSSLINQNMAQLGAPLPFNGGGPTTGAFAPTPTSGGVGSMGERMMANLQGLLELSMMAKAMGPVMNSITNSMSGGSGGPSDGNQQILEMMKRLDKQEQDRVVDGLRNEIKALQQKPPDAGSNAQIEMLKFQLQTIQGQQAKDAETARLQIAMDAGKNTGNNVEKMYENMTKVSTDANMKLETEKLAHQRDVEAASARERQYYTDRLRDMETKLQAIQSTTTMSPLEQYTQMRTVIQGEVENLQKITGSDKGSSIPEILQNVAKEFAPAVTEFVRIRGAAGPTPAAGPRPVGPQAAAQAVGAEARKLQGQCPWCTNTVIIDDVDGPVPCPSCQKALYPHGQPAEGVQAPTAPNVPDMPTAMPVPISQPVQSSTAIPPTIEYIGSDGQLHQKRNPLAATII